MSCEPCIVCEPHGANLERVRYYPRQLIDAEDMRTEQDYFRQKLRRHNRLAHGWGVVCGLRVKAHPSDEEPWRVRVCAGYALGPQGDEIYVEEPIDLDLATGIQTPSDPCADTLPCPPVGSTAGKDERTVYLAIRYCQCYSRPERVHPVGCACDESACEYARIRDAAELGILSALPDSHAETDEAFKKWLDEFKKWLETRGKGAAGDDIQRTAPPVPPCPDCPDEPWVVLATIRLPNSADSPVTAQDIGYEDRRLILSVSALQRLMV